MSQDEVQQLAARLDAIEDRLASLETGRDTMRRVEANQDLLMEAVREIGSQVGKLLVRHQAEDLGG